MDLVIDLFTCNRDISQWVCLLTYEPESKLNENVISPTIVNRVEEALHKEKSQNNRPLDPQHNGRVVRSSYQYLGIGVS